MAGDKTSHKALFIVIILLIAIPFDLFVKNGHNPAESVLNDEHNVMNVMIGEENYLEFSNNGLLNQQISLDIPAKDPLTDLQFTAKPDVKVMRSGFVWNSVNSWQHADSDNNGTLVVNNEFLSADLAQQELVYDFENPNSLINGQTYVAPWFGNNNRWSETIVNPLSGSRSVQAGCLAIDGCSSSITLPVTVSEEFDVSFNYKVSSESNWDYLRFCVDDMVCGNLGSNPNVIHWSGTLSGVHTQTIPANSQTLTWSYSKDTICCASGSDTAWIDNVRMTVERTDAAWISPSIGWDSSSTEVVERLEYSPLYLDAYIPDYTYLNWTIIDDSGNIVNGLQGVNDLVIPLNLVNHEDYPKVRVKLDFHQTNQTTDVPVVYSISGDGANHKSFVEHFDQDFWNENCQNNDVFAPCGEISQFEITEPGTSYLSSTNVPIATTNGTGLSVDFVASTAYFDQVETISGISAPGRVYTSSSNIGTSGGSGTGLQVSTTATAIEADKVETASISNLGSGYTSTTNQPLNFGSSSGLIIDYQASPITSSGLVDNSQLQSGGSGYVANGQTVQTTTNGNGNGMEISYAANQYITGIVDQVSMANEGTGYYDTAIKSTSGGSGFGLTVTPVLNLSAPSVGSASSISELNDGEGYSEGIASTYCINCQGSATGLTINVTWVSEFTSPFGRIMDYDLENGGTGYSVGDEIGVFGFNNSNPARYEVDSIGTQGQVLSVNIANGGSGYSVGDIITIIDGNNDSLIQVTGTTETGGVIQSYTLENPGSGYQVNDIIYVNGGVTDAQLRVNSVYSVGGNITSLSIVDAGSGYTVGQILSIPNGDLNAEIRIDTTKDIGGNVTSASIQWGGQGYSLNDLITINGGDNQAQFEVLSLIDTGGNITSLTASSGNDYSIGDSFVIPGGQGDAEAFVTDIEQTGYRGGSSCTITSDWIYTTAPVKEIVGDYEGFNSNVRIQVNDDATWSDISSNGQISLQSSDIIYRYRFNISVDTNAWNFWSISDIKWSEYSGMSVTNPTIDLFSDGDLEWGVKAPQIGQWGWQDRLVSGNVSSKFTIGLSGLEVVDAWIPKDNLQSLSIGVVSNTGFLNSVNIIVGGTLISQHNFVSQSFADIKLNQSELDALKIVASGMNPIGNLNASFIPVQFEIFGTGVKEVLSFSAPYPTEISVYLQKTSSFIFNANEMRTKMTNQQGLQQFNLPFNSESQGAMSVVITGYNYSSDVEFVQSSMSENIPVLTTSQRWLTMNSQFRVLSSNAGTARLDVIGSENHATWIIPTGGGAPIGQGDSNLLELHPVSPLNYSINGDIVDLSVTFRIEPGWDDDNFLKATTRIVLANSVISMPATHTWGGQGENDKAVENDLEIKEVIFSNQFGQLSADDYYIMAGEQLSFSIDIGYEDLSGTESFADGDAVVTLYSGSTQLANTTTLNIDRWDFTYEVPFTNRELDFIIEITPLNGSGVTADALFNRQLFSDSVAPSVYSSSLAAYDHRVPSSTQTIQVEITDQPLLPSNIEAMVWREWINDYDMNGQPSPNEYSPISSVLLPNDLTDLVGQYTILLDDSGGVIGDKVAVYLTGNDAAGRPLEDNGTGEEGNHLFMYQLKADGPPSIPTTAFSWDGGRQTWLHPMIEYEFEVLMSEPNGGSDLSTVEVQLASQQNSDQLSIFWNFITGNCTTTSPHLVIDDCDMIGQNGPAGPYEIDLALNVKFHLLWTIPDLGDTKREPKLIVMDRAGNTDQQAFPTLRWRSSGDMYIPDETIQLFIDQGTVVEDGARIAPSSSFEVSGDVLFKETNTRPDFDCPVNVMFDSVSYPVTALNGAWTAVVTASESSGKKALTWGVDCYSGQGGDVTDESDNRWILVDGTGPTPIEIINPRPNTILETDVYEVRVAIDEEGGLDIDSLQLEWWVEDELTGDRLTTGFEPMSLEGTDISGPQIEVYAEIDLSGITDTMIQNRLILFIKINGRDLADNSVQGMNGAPSGGEIAQWNLEWLRPEFSIGPLDVSYTRLIIEVGQSTSVQALVDNTGSLDGTVDATVYVVKLNGSKDVLQRPSIDIPAGGKGLITVDWAPTSQGIQWIEVELDNGQTSKGPTVDVRPARDQGFVENLFGDVNPVIGSIVALIFVSIIATGLLWARKATRGKGARSEHDWDEYSSEMEDDDYDEDEDENGVDYAAAESSPNTQEIQPASSLGAASAALGVAQTTPAAEAETDWVMGSDGYWWYHNKATNEWWYKDENGDIVQFN